MMQTAKVVILVLMGLSLSGCWLKATGNSPMAPKRITPSMESQMEILMEKGCNREYPYLDRNVAMLYSVFPGGGQFYTGEIGKGLLYLVSTPLLFPYFASFRDAQISVDYYNFKYTIHYCMKKFKMKRKRPKRPRPPKKPEPEIIIQPTR